MARITGFREIRGEEFEIEGFKVARIPHVVPVYIVWNREGFAVLGFMVDFDFDTGEASAEVLVYESTLSQRLLRQLAGKIAEKL